MEEREISIAVSKGAVRGDLAVPEEAKGVVLFAHGSGSSRFSSRNRQVAGFFQKSGLATLLVDLLTEEEAAEDQRTQRLRFDMDLLSDHLTSAAAWLGEEPQTRDLLLGCIGSSTGAALALIAAAAKPEMVSAIVSRGGRPDLAVDRLSQVKAPTLLIVGGADYQVLELNRMALERLPCEKKLEIVPGASHLFGEPGTLEVASRLAAEWFIRHLRH